MAYKDFINLGRQDSALVVPSPLLSIRNAVDAAVSGVAVVSQAAASYAKQYAVVEKQEVDSEGHVSDTTNDARRSVALYELFDTKRRVQQVEANIAQYISNIGDVTLPTATRNILAVHVTTIPDSTLFRLYKDGSNPSTWSIRVTPHLEWQDGALTLGITWQFVNNASTPKTGIGCAGMDGRVFARNGTGTVSKAQRVCVIPIAQVVWGSNSTPGSGINAILTLQVSYDEYIGEWAVRPSLGYDGSCYVGAKLDAGAGDPITTENTQDIAVLTRDSVGHAVLFPSSTASISATSPMGSRMDDFQGMVTRPLENYTETKWALWSTGDNSPQTRVSTVTFDDPSKLSQAIEGLMPDFASVVDAIDSLTTTA